MSRPALILVAAAAALTLAVSGCSSAGNAPPAASSEPAAQPAPEVSEAPGPAEAELGSDENPYPAGAPVEFQNWTVELLALLPDRYEAMEALSDAPSITGEQEVVELQYRLTRTASTAGDYTDISPSITNKNVPGNGNGMYHSPSDIYQVEPGQTIDVSYFQEVGDGLWDAEPFAWLAEITTGEQPAAYIPVS